MFTFIKPHTNFDFMGLRKKVFIFSAVVSVVSIILLFTKGLNLSIEFNGGSSAIVAFERGAVTDRAKIADSVSTMLATDFKRADTSVSVQDFGAGAGDRIDGKDVDRFLIYTEVTSLVDDAKRAEIIAALEKRFNAPAAEKQPGDAATGAVAPKIKIATSPDAGDTFYLTFADERGITATESELAELFKPLGFQKITVTSDLEREVEVEFLRDVDLARQDLERAEDPAQAEKAKSAIPTQADFEKRRDAQIAGKSDKRFTVEVEALQAAFEKALSGSFGKDFVTVESSAMVSASVGSDLLNDGFLAILYSLIGILVYIALRYDFRFAPGGVVALLHDAIITMGFVAALDLKFSLQILAAILTIVGYSINDSVIIYDRIRETLAGHKGEDLIKLINRAINDTLSRTVITGGTSVLSLFAILGFGGAQLADFAITLAFGIVFGTYSSIFVSAPLVIYFDHYATRREAEKKAREKNANKGSDQRKQAGASV